MILSPLCHYICCSIYTPDPRFYSSVLQQAYMTTTTTRKLINVANRCLSSNLHPIFVKSLRHSQVVILVSLLSSCSVMFVWHFLNRTNEAFGTTYLRGLRMLVILSNHDSQTVTLHHVIYSTSTEGSKSHWQMKMMYF